MSRRKTIQHAVRLLADQLDYAIPTASMTVKCGSRAQDIFMRGLVNTVALRGALEHTAETNQVRKLMSILRDEEKMESVFCACHWSLIGERADLVRDYTSALRMIINGK